MWGEAVLQHLPAQIETVAKCFVRCFDKLHSTLLGCQRSWTVAAWFTRVVKYAFC